jgi:hypothetical protein
MSSSPAAPGASTASLADFHRPVRMMPHEAVTATVSVTSLVRCCWGNRVGQERNAYQMVNRARTATSCIAVTTSLDEYV